MDDSDRCHRCSEASYSEHSGMAHLLNLSGPNAYPLPPPGEDIQLGTWGRTQPETVPPSPRKDPLA
ncbi:hypothetical protein BJV78DRAFT_1243205, partial [Lactifluus subvellereus]